MGPIRKQPWYFWRVVLAKARAFFSVGIYVPFWDRDVRARLCVANAAPRGELSRKILAYVRCPSLEREREREIKQKAAVIVIYYADEWCMKYQYVRIYVFCFVLFIFILLYTRGYILTVRELFEMYEDTVVCSRGKGGVFVDANIMPDNAWQEDSCGGGNVRFTCVWYLSSGGEKRCVCVCVSFLSFVITLDILPSRPGQG